MKSDVDMVISVKTPEEGTEAVLEKLRDFLKGNKGFALAMITNYGTDTPPGVTLCAAGDLETAHLVLFSAEAMKLSKKLVSAKRSKNTSQCNCPVCRLARAIQTTH